MEAKLIPVVGIEGAEVVPLQPEQPVVFGRGDVCTVSLTHSKVSRLHCRIAHENGFYTVEDLQSKNGTWVNNRRIHKAPPVPPRPHHRRGRRLPIRSGGQPHHGTRRPTFLWAGFGREIAGVAYAHT